MQQYLSVDLSAVSLHLTTATTANMRIFSTCLAIVMALNWCNGAMVSAAEQFVPSIKQSVNSGGDIRPQLNGSLGSDKPYIQAYEKRDSYDKNKVILLDHNSGGTTPHSQTHSSGRSTATNLDYQSLGVIPSSQGDRFAEDKSYPPQNRHGRHVTVMSPHHGYGEDTSYSSHNGYGGDTSYSSHNGFGGDTSYSSHNPYGEVILDNKGQNYGGASTQYQGQVYGAENYEGKYASGSTPNFHGQGYGGLVTDYKGQGQGYGGLVTDYKGQGQGYGETSFSSSKDSESTIYSHEVDDQTQYQIKQFGLHQLYDFGATAQTGQTEITHSVEISSMGHDNEKTASGKTHFSIHSNYLFGSDEHTGSSFTDEDLGKVIEYCHQNHPNCTSEVNDSNVTESCEIILNQLNVTACAEEPGFIKKIGIYFLNGVNELKNFIIS